MQILSVNNMFSLLNGYVYQNNLARKKFLKFQSKDIANETGNESRLPSLVTRYMTYAAMRRKNLVEIMPYILNVAVQFVVGSNVFYSAETHFVIADNNQLIADRVSWGTVARLPMEATVVVKVQLFSKEGEGMVVGVGAMKLFD
jgi:hypothetical protein